MKKHYLGEPINIYIQSLINIIVENNCVISTKKGKGKLQIFCGNGEQVIIIYAWRVMIGVPFPLWGGWVPTPSGYLFYHFS